VESPKFKPLITREFKPNLHPRNGRFDYFTMRFQIQKHPNASWDKVSEILGKMRRKRWRSLFNNLEMASKRRNRLNASWRARQGYRNYCIDPRTKKVFRLEYKDDN